MAGNDLRFLSVRVLEDFFNSIDPERSIGRSQYPAVRKGPGKHSQGLNDPLQFDIMRSVAWPWGIGCISVNGNDASSSRCSAA